MRAGVPSLLGDGAALPTGGLPAALTTARRWLVALLTIGLAASISLSEVVFAALAVIAIVTGRAESRRQPPGPAAASWPLAVPIAAFAAWTVVSALVSARPLESLVAAKTIIWLAVVYVVLHSLPDRASAHRFATLLFVAVSVVAALSIAQVGFCPVVPETTGLTGWFFHKCGRARGFFSIYMTLAGVLSLVLVATLPGVVRTGRRSWWMAAAWLAGVAALALTYVRGAWIGFAVGIAICAVALGRRAVVLAAIVVIAIAGAAALPGVMDRAITLSHGDDTARDRLAMLHGGWHIVREHLITGVGVGGVKRLYPSYAPPEALRHSTSHLHDTPLQILVERGVIGLALWVLIYATFFVRALRVLRTIPAAEGRDRALVLGAIAAVASFLVAGLFEYNFGDTEVLFVANAVMALPFVIERSLRSG